MQWTCPKARHIVLALMAAALAPGALAQNPALPIAPERLATALPSTPWGDVTRQKPELQGTTVPVKRSQAKVAFQGKRGSTEPFLANFILSDEGDYGAGMYGYGAKYMTEDVKDDTQRSLVLPGGQRALLTSYTKNSMEIETFVGKRFVARTSCVNADEAQCIAAFSKWDFKAIAALKP